MLPTLLFLLQWAIAGESPLYLEHSDTYEFIRGYDKDTVFIGASATYKSTDGGVTWVDLGKVELDGEEVRVRGSYLSNKKQGMVYAATIEKLIKSINYGTDWMDITDGLTERKVVGVTT